MLLPVIDSPTQLCHNFLEEECGKLTAPRLGRRLGERAMHMPEDLFVHFGLPLFLFILLVGL